MDVTQPLCLLGGISPQRFMQRHWQKKPLLVRDAVPGMQPPLSRTDLFACASLDSVESRLVQQPRDGQGWRMRRGPMAQRSLPPRSRPGWTLLLQGMDLQDDRLRAVLEQFRFLPDARLDDLMVSYATDGGGVGPHVDSYDVFLLQAHGRRRWRIALQKDMSLREDTPLKVLRHFAPEAEYLLEPGDMLYLPPGWAHDGVADGECMTYSIGFRAPTRGEIAAALLARLADEPEGRGVERRYRDPRQVAVDTPAAIPGSLHDFARDALQAVLAEPDALHRVLGEYLTEPKPATWFDAADGDADNAVQGTDDAVVLDRRTRMAYDAHHVFINGESYRAAGRDAVLMRRLADRRLLDAVSVRRASDAARSLLAEWRAAGWLHERSS